MENEEKRLQYLFQRYLNGKISEEEYHEFWTLLQAQGNAGHALQEELQSLWSRSAEEMFVIPEGEWNARLKQWPNEVQASGPAPAVRRISWRRTSKRIVAAAATIAILVLGYFYFQTNRPAVEDTAALQHKEPEDLLPGGNKAVLTLANGSTIILDSAAGGAITRQGNASVLKLRGGQIVYNTVNENTAEVVYNTLSTPRGGQYRLTLPDGSRVWLNAASSIRFPTAFTDRERHVEITGEAYFEVTGNAERPFTVSVNGMQVKVLGTRFNIMAYDDEALVKTTLLRGVVAVTKGDDDLLLEPGQQAQLNKDGSIRMVKDPDISAVLAWRNNLFWFNNDDIGTVMRQVGRWYNVDVEIRGDITRHFTGSIPRNVNVSKVFKVLQETGSLHFTIEDKKIIVSP